MTKIKKYATFTVALGVLVAGYININGVYATQCDTCGNNNVGVAQSNNNNNSNSSNGNGATLGVGATNSTSQQSDNSSNLNGQGNTDASTDSDSTTGNVNTQAMENNQNRYLMQYQTQSTVCSQLANQFSASINNMVNLANSLSVNQKSIAEQLLGIADLQVKDNDTALEALDKSQQRSNFTTFFIGPDYDQLLLAKQVWQRNQLRIQELNQIKEQLSNSADATNLETQITTLEQQNTSLLDALENQTKIFSLFGWISKLINRY